MGERYIFLLPSHRITSSVHAINMTVTVDINLDHLVDIVFVMFLQCIFIIPGPYILRLLEISHYYVQPTCKEWRVMVHFLESEMNV